MNNIESPRVKARPEKIVILGAGVAGLKAALLLEKKLDPKLGEIILVDQHDYHQLLYRIHKVCNSRYDERDMIIPMERLIMGRKIQFVKTTVKTIDPYQRLVETSDGEMTFDKLVIALGSHVAYFGIEGLEENSFALSSYDAAKKIRSRIENLFEKAEGTGKPPEIVLGGGGFTGVELAGEIADWFPVLCEKHDLARPQNLLKLVEMMNTILPAWNRALAQRCQKVMGEIGVELHLSDPVVWVTENSIELKSGEILEPDLFVWTGGVTRDPACGPYFDIKSGRIAIDRYCRADEFEDIYVAGDCARTVNESGLTMSPTAHIAMGQAAIVAHNIVASLMGDPLKPYVFNHVGEIVTIGRSFAAGDLFGIGFSGFLAKAMKKIIHWWYLYSIGGLSLLLER